VCVGYVRCLKDSFWRQAVPINFRLQMLRPGSLGLKAVKV
jgi:hypothetical protein